MAKIDIPVQVHHRDVFYERQGFQQAEPLVQLWDKHKNYINNNIAIDLSAIFKKTMDYVIFLYEVLDCAA